MSYWKHQKELLKNRSFQFYLYSCIAGTFASGLAYIITIWMIVSFHTNINATLIGMILFWVPSLILNPYFGAIVDHHDRKKLIIFAESARTLMYVIVGILMLYQPTLWVVYLLLILAGCFAALYKPLLPAFVHELVHEEQLLYANTNINIAYEIGNIVGRGIITVLVLTFISTYEALFIVAILYFISTVTMFPIRRYSTDEHVAPSQKLNFIQMIHDGYRYLFSNRELFFYVLIQSLILMGLMAAPVLVGPYVKTILHAGNRVFGISEAALSIGAVVGAFFWSYLAHHISKERCLAIASILASFSYLTLANTSELYYALIAFLILGFSWGSFSLIMSMVQMLTEKKYQGRVQATIGAAVTVVFILFSIFLYSANEEYSAQHAFMLLTFLSLFVFIGIILIPILRKRGIK